MKTQKHTFEVLMVDPSGKSEITTVKSLVRAMSYSEKLWKNPSVSTEQAKIEDQELGIAFYVSKLDTKSEGVAFIVRAIGSNLGTLEAFRERLFGHAILKLGFDQARILTDTLSEDLSLALYPLIKSVENALRNHLQKVLLQTYGLGWWEQVVPQAVNQQVNAKIGYEQHFRGLVDSRMSLTDFEDLTSLLKTINTLDSNFVAKWDNLAVLRKRALSHSVFTSQEYTTTEQLCKELMSILGQEPAPLTQPNPQAFQQVQEKPQNGYVSTTTAPVQERVTVQEPVVAAVVQQSQAPTPAPVSTPVPVAEVKQPVAAPVAETKTEPVYVTPEPAPVAVSTPATVPVFTPAPAPVVEAAAPAAAPTQHIGNEGNIDLITESILLQELKATQNQLNGQYVDFKAFVTKTLEHKGYAVGSSYMVAKNLNEKGIVQIYETKDAKGAFVKAIRAK